MSVSAHSIGLKVCISAREVVYGERGPWPDFAEAHGARVLMSSMKFGFEGGTRSVSIDKCMEQDNQNCSQKGVI